MSERHERFFGELSDKDLERWLHPTDEERAERARQERANTPESVLNELGIY